MQIWQELDGKLEKILINPRKHDLQLLKVEKDKSPGIRFWLTYLDRSCNDAELKNMLRQARFRKKPYFEEVGL